MWLCGTVVLHSFSSISNSFLKSGCWNERSDQANKRREIDEFAMKRGMKTKNSKMMMCSED